MSDENYFKLEYEQVCQNIRQSWDYIVALTRNVIIFQIILITLVGLGGKLITIDKLKVDISSQDNVHLQTEPQNSLGGQEKQTINVNTEIRSISLVSLGFLGMLISVSFYVQTRNIFMHASAFVARAAKLEGEFKHLSEKKVTSESDFTHHQYMLNRLNVKKVLTAEQMLLGLHLLAFFFWAFVTYKIFNNM